MFFGAGAPKNPGGLILAVVLSIAALFTIGLTIAAVEAMQESMVHCFPRAAPLLVLAAYALISGFLAKRFFRWE